MLWARACPGAPAFSSPSFYKTRMCFCETWDSVILCSGAIRGESQIIWGDPGRDTYDLGRFGARRVRRCHVFRGQAISVFCRDSVRWVSRSLMCSVGSQAGHTCTAETNLFDV